MPISTDSYFCPNELEIDKTDPAEAPDTPIQSDRAVTNTLSSSPPVTHFSETNHTSSLSSPNSSDVDIDLPTNRIMNSSPVPSPKLSKRVVSMANLKLIRQKKNQLRYFNGSVQSMDTTSEDFHSERVLLEGKYEYNGSSDIPVRLELNDVGYGYVESGRRQKVEIEGYDDDSVVDNLKPLPIRQTRPMGIPSASMLMKSPDNFGSRHDIESLDTDIDSQSHSQIEHLSPSSSPERAQIDSTLIIDTPVSLIYPPHPFYSEVHQDVPSIGVPSSTKPSVRRQTRRDSIYLGNNELIGSLVGSYEESILSGRMSSHPSKPITFLSEVGVLGIGKCKSSLKCPPHIHLAFPAFFYQLPGNDAPSPYVGTIDLQSAVNVNGEGNEEGYRLPPRGQLQVMVKNPSKTVVKVFLIPYDFRDMPANTKTFIRQKSYAIFSSTSPKSASLASSASSQPSSSPPASSSHLRYAIHLQVKCTRKKRIYLYKNIRIVFSPRPPESNEKLKIVTEGPKEPRYMELSKDDNRSSTDFLISHSNYERSTPVTLSTQSSLPGNFVSFNSSSTSSSSPSPASRARYSTSPLSRYSITTSSFSSSSTKSSYGDTSSSLLAPASQTSPTSSTVRSNGRNPSRRLSWPRSVRIDPDKLQFSGDFEKDLESVVACDMKDSVNPFPKATPNLKVDTMGTQSQSDEVESGYHSGKPVTKQKRLEDSVQMINSYSDCRNSCPTPSIDDLASQIFEIGLDRDCDVRNTSRDCLGICDDESEISTEYPTQGR